MTDERLRQIESDFMDWNDCWCIFPWKACLDADELIVEVRRLREESEGLKGTILAMDIHSQSCEVCGSCQYR